MKSHVATVAQSWRISFACSLWCRSLINLKLYNMSKVEITEKSAIMTEYLKVRLWPEFMEGIDGVLCCIFRNRSGRKWKRNRCRRVRRSRWRLRWRLRRRRRRVQSTRSTARVRGIAATVMPRVRSRPRLSLSLYPLTSTAPWRCRASSSRIWWAVMTCGTKLIGWSSLCIKVSGVFFWGGTSLIPVFGIL